MKRLLILIVWLITVLTVHHACAQTNKWCEKDPNHPLCICEKQPDHPNCCCTPVVMIDFTAKATESIADLQFDIASEENNDHFTIERSPDALEWEVVTTIKGRGTTLEPKRYTYTDLNPISEHTYYRLSQFDLNGESKQLGIQFVKFKWHNIEGHKVYGDVVSYQYFNANGGISGNDTPGFKILKVTTKNKIYVFKVWK